MHDGALLTDALELHLIELPRLAQSVTEREGELLTRWARFLRFEGVRALELLANEDPVMAEAKEALERLSQDPEARRLAALREEADLVRRLERGDLLAEGRAQGREEQGRASVLALFRARGLVLSDEQRGAIEACKDLAQLEDWMTRAATATTADEVFAPGAR